MSKLIAIVGPNASGKSTFGLELAKIVNAEIISADSRQIYRGFDLCSGKITPEEMKTVPHHLIDIRDIGEPFSVFDYQKAAYSIIPQILHRNKVPFIVGGTGLYVHSVIDGYVLREEAADCELRGKLEELCKEELQSMLTPEGKAFLAKNPSDYSNKRRIIRVIIKTALGEPLEYENAARYDALRLGVKWPKEKLQERISARLELRIKQGMIDEVKTYLDNGGKQEYLYNLGLEYRYILWYLTGKFRSLDEFKRETEQAIKHFAKRQLTWFRRDAKIHWIDMDVDYTARVHSLVSEFLEDGGKFGS